MNIKASVNYHVKRDFSQAFQFDVDGIEGNLISPELRPTEVKVRDLKGSPEKLNFDNDGITFVHAESKVRDFTCNEEWTTGYEQEISALLKGTIGAQDVLVFDHTVRIDEANAVRKPARNVHNDYTEKAANQRLIDLIREEKAAEYQQGRFAFVNVWRPIEQAITSSPLGFIHPNSVTVDDWLTIDLVYPNRKGEILGVTANSAHDWFYRSNMTPDEVIIFNIYDNQGRPYLAHSALDIVGQAIPSIPRKSIETRTLVRY